MALMILGTIIISPVSATSTPIKPEFCNQVPAGTLVKIDKDPSLSNEFMKILLNPSISVDTSCTHYGTTVYFSGSSTTVPLTSILYMGTNAVLCYSSDGINWYTTNNAAVNTGSPKSSTYASAVKYGATSGYYLTWGCNVGTFNDGSQYHYDDYSDPCQVP
jgi:hypothetical protein